MGKKSNQPTPVSQEQYNKDLDQSLEILHKDGASDQDLIDYTNDYKSRFVVAKSIAQKKNLIQNGVSNAGNGSSDFLKSSKSEFEVLLESDIRATKKLEKPQILLTKGEEAKILAKNAKAKNNMNLSLERLQTEKEQSGFLNTVGSIAKNIWNVTGTGLSSINETLGGDKDYFVIPDYKPLQDQKKKYIEKAERENLPKTPEAVQKGAEDIFIKEDQFQQFQKNLDAELPEDYDRKGIWKELKLENLNKNDALRQAVITSEVYESQLKEFDKYAEYVKKLPKEEITNEIAKKYNGLLDDAKESKEGLTYLQESFPKLLKEVKTSDELVDVFKYNYNDYEKAFSNIKNFAKSLAGGTVKIAAESLIYIDEKTDEPGSKQTSVYKMLKKGLQATKEIANEVLDEASSEREQFITYKAKDISNLGDFGSYMADLGTNQLPVYLTLAIAPEFGSALLGTQSAGEQFRNMEVEEMQPFAKQTSFGQKLLTSYVYCASETLFERLGTVNVIKNIEASIAIASNASRKLIRESVIDSSIRGAKQYGFNSFIEGGTEYLTAEAQIQADINIAGKDISTQQAMERRSESTVAGALMGGTMSLVGGLWGGIAEQAKLYSDSQDIQKTTQILSKIDALSNELKNNPNLAKEDKDIIYKKMTDLGDESFDIVTRNAEKGKTFSAEENKFLVGVNAMQDGLKKEFEKLKNSNISPEQKQLLTDDYNTQFNQLEQNRQKTLKGEFSTIPDIEKVFKKEVQQEDNLIDDNVNPADKKYNDIWVRNEKDIPTGPDRNPNDRYNVVSNSEELKKFEEQEKAKAQPEDVSLTNEGNKLETAENINTKDTENPLVKAETQQPTDEELLNDLEEDKADTSTKKEKKYFLSGNKITTNKGESYDIEIFDGINGKVNSVEDRQNKEKLSLGVRSTDGINVGEVSFWKQEDGTYVANNVNIRDAHRRKGLASAMYDFAKKTGITIKNSENQTDLGIAFKNSYNLNNDSLPEITAQEYLDFVEKDFLSDERLNDIATKVRENKDLTAYEKRIAKKKENQIVGINKKVQDEVNEVNRKAEVDTLSKVPAMEKDEFLEYTNSEKATDERLNAIAYKKANNVEFNNFEKEVYQDNKKVVDKINKSRNLQENILDKIPNQQKHKTKEGKYTVATNGKQLDLYDTNGQPAVLSPKTKQKYFLEAIENGFMKRTEELQYPDGINETEAERFELENETDPSVILEKLQNTEISVDGATASDFKEFAIAIYINKVTQSTFVRFSDKNYITRGIALTYFSKEGQPIDTLAQEISESMDIDVTPQDIVDFIVANPNGKRNILTVKNPVYQNLIDSFVNITGFAPTPSQIMNFKSKEVTPTQIDFEFANEVEVNNEIIERTNLDEAASEFDKWFSSLTPNEQVEFYLDLDQDYPNEYYQNRYNKQQDYEQSAKTTSAEKLDGQRKSEPNDSVGENAQQDRRESGNDNVPERKSGEIEAKGEQGNPHTGSKGIKPIRQLGSGSNVYFESNGIRVNDFKGGFIMNVQSQEDFGGASNWSIKFDNVEEAVTKAERLAKIYNKGVPRAVLLEQLLDDMLNPKAGERKEEKPKTEAKQEEANPEQTEPKQSKRKVRDEKVDAELDDAFKDLRDELGKLMSGINPELAIKAAKIIAIYTKAGIYKLSDIIEDAYAKFGEISKEMFDALKQGYASYYATAEDSIADQMNSNVRIFTYETLINKIQDNEQQPTVQRVPNPIGALHPNSKRPSKTAPQELLQKPSTEQGTGTRSQSPSNPVPRTIRTVKQSSTGQGDLFSTNAGILETEQTPAPQKDKIEVQIEQINQAEKQEPALVDFSMQDNEQDKFNATKKYTDNIDALKTLLENSIKDTNYLEDKIEDYKQQLKDNKLTARQVFDDIIAFLQTNQIKGKITPTEINRLIKSAAEITIKKDTENALDDFMKLYEVIKEKALLRSDNRAREQAEIDYVLPTVEMQVESGFTLEMVLDYFETDSQKRMAEIQYHKEKSKFTTKEERVNKAKKSLEKQKQDLFNATYTSFREGLKKARLYWFNLISDRSYVPAELMSKTGMQQTYYQFKNTKGYGHNAKEMYEKAYDKIWKSLTQDKIELLHDVIQMMRIITIDDNRTQNGLAPVQHPNNLSSTDANTWLQDQKDTLGDKAFNNIEKRAKEYFKSYQEVLDLKLENGFISQETYDALNGLDYQPRMFLHHAVNFDGDLTFEQKQHIILRSGLSKEQIKSLEDGSANSLILDAQWLLSNSISTLYQDIADNNLNSLFIAEEFPIAKEKYDDLVLKPADQLTKEEKRFIRYFKELSDKVIPNEIIGFNANTNDPIYKNDTPKNFVNKHYWADGVKNQFFMEENLAQQFDGAKGLFLNESNKQVVGNISGARLVKYFATGNNPLFVIVNTPRDFMWNILVSEHYSTVLPIAMTQMTYQLFPSTYDFILTKLGRENTDMNLYMQHGGSMDYLHKQGQIAKKSFADKFIVKPITSVLGENNQPIVEDAIKNNYLSKAVSALNEWSEIAFRIATFRRSINASLKELGFENENQITDLTDENGAITQTQKEILDNIYRKATYDARSILDFSQGGRLTKDLEEFIPYANVGVQATRSYADAIRKRPISTTLKTLQIATMGAAGFIPLAMFMLAGDDDEPEEEQGKKVERKYVEFMQGVSEETRSKYYLIPTKNRDEKGNRIAYKIAKDQFLIPYTNIVETLIENRIRTQSGFKEIGWDKIGKRLNKDIFEYNLSAKSIKDVPLFKAGVAWHAGYDLYRNKPLDKYAKSEELEGIHNPQVEDFYKQLGVQWKISPIRTKSAIESIITSPQSNPYLATGYEVMDYAFTDKSMNHLGTGVKEMLLKGLKNRTITKSTEWIRTENLLQDTKAQQVDAMLKEEVTRQLFKDKAEEVTKELFKDKSEKEILDIIQNKPEVVNDLVSPVIDDLEAQYKDDANYSSYVKSFRSAIKSSLLKQGTSVIMQKIKREKSPGAKAIMIREIYGDINSPENEEIKNKLISKRIINAATLRYLEKKTAN